jgi:hypothetical protein
MKRLSPVAVVALAALALVAFARVPVTAAAPGIATADDADRPVPAPAAA